MYISVCVYMHKPCNTMEALKKEGRFSFAATWMALEGVMLSEINKRQILYNITYMWDLKFKGIGSQIIAGIFIIF